MCLDPRGLGGGEAGHPVHRQRLLSPALTRGNLVRGVDPLEREVLRPRGVHHAAHPHAGEDVGGRGRALEVSGAGGGRGGRRGLRHGHTPAHQAGAAAVHAHAPLEAAHGAGVVRDTRHHEVAGGHPHGGRGVRGHVIREAAGEPVRGRPVGATILELKTVPGS